MGGKAEDKLRKILETQAGIADQVHQLDAKGASVASQKYLLKQTV